MSHSALNLAGKSVIAVAGLVYGFRRGFDPVRQIPSPARLEEIAARIENLERLEKARLAEPSPERSDLTTADLASTLTGSRRFESNAAVHYNVSHLELAEAVDRATARIFSEVDRRFEIQKLSLGSLRSLILQTDQMLERVLSHLEDHAAGDGVSEDDILDDMALDQPLLASSGR